MAGGETELFLVDSCTGNELKKEAHIEHRVASHSASRWRSSFVADQLSTITSDTFGKYIVKCSKLFEYQYSISERYLKVEVGVGVYGWIGAILLMKNEQIPSVQGVTQG